MVKSISDIDYCQASERETLIYIKGIQYNVNCSISEFYKKLPKKSFFRSHRSFIINSVGLEDRRTESKTHRAAEVGLGDLRHEDDDGMGVALDELVRVSIWRS